MKITTIAFDGDDTLWHHENYFKHARESFSSLMNELGEFPDAIDRADNQHIVNLPVWGYGVKSFTLSMLEAAVDMTHGTISGNEIKRIMDIGRSLYQHPLILLDHVAETISYLHTRYRLVLITKGDLVAQEVKIAQSKLAPFFEATEIVSEKDTATYRRLCLRNHIKPEELLMVGNSMKSDILPPVELGAQAVYIPYQTTWKHERADIEEKARAKFMTLPNMKNLVSLIDGLQHTPNGLLSELVLPADFV